MGDDGGGGGGGGPVSGEACAVDVVAINGGGGDAKAMAGNFLGSCDVCNLPTAPNEVRHCISNFPNVAVVRACKCTK
jgi:hypothetical protein